MAIKVIDKDDDNYIEMCDVIENEIKILFKLPKSHHIIEFYDKIETVDKIYLVFQLFEGDELFSIVKRKKRLQENEACHYFYEIIKTIQKLCEDANIAHRDIKAENILVNLEFDDVKLIDFGFSRLIEAGKLMKTACGSPHYSAPEVLAKEKYDPYKADIWSAGVLLFFMLCGTLSLNKAIFLSSMTISRIYTP